MTGFPALPNRTAFGPTYVNSRPVQNADREFGADAANLIAWQVAGASHTVAQACILYDGVDEVTLWQSLAFDPNVKLGNIQILKYNVGYYRIAFDPAYADERGTLIQFSPVAAIAMVQGGASQEAPTILINGLNVDVRIFDSVDTPIDRTFFITIWSDPISAVVFVVEPA
jgi:hypothetical protein